MCRKKEFKVLNENSKPIKETNVLKKTGGAVVGGLLTGGVGAIIGAMVTGNKTRKDLKINLGFKLKNKDWFSCQVPELCNIIRE